MISPVRDKHFPNANAPERHLNANANVPLGAAATDARHRPSSSPRREPREASSEQPGNEEKKNQ